MDVLDPEKIWVNGHRYRFFESNVWSNQLPTAPYQEEYQAELEDMSEACENDEIIIEKIDGGRYRHSLDIPSVFYGHIVGRQGSKRKELERETNTTIRVPYENSTGLVVITGMTEGDVISCKHRIDLLKEKSRERMPFTHFVSIPLINDEIVGNYEKFRDEILKNSEFKNCGIVEEMFVDSNKLHLTIGMLQLFDDKEKREAIEALNESVERIVKPILEDVKKPLMIKIQGLDCMNDDPTQVTVLYGRVWHNETLQEIADKVFGFFIEKKLIQSTKKKVKLHMTLMKSSKLIPREEKGKKRIDFNVEKIFKEFKNHKFGEIELKTLDICFRGDNEADGSYKTITKVELT